MISNALRKTLPFLSVILLLTLSACSLAEDVTPPPGYQAPTIQQPVSVGPNYPLVPPDPNQGAIIYAEKCTPCHGDTGKGDGPQASQLPNPVPPIGSLEVARQASPSEWYQIVTHGNLERFMPGFTNSLNDRQRWDVVAYVYSLSTSEETLAEGEAIYQLECAGCHGTQGLGDGPESTGLGIQPPSFQDKPRMAQQSATDLFQVISSGSGQVMPAFAERLSEDQRWSVAAYVQAYSIRPGTTGGLQASAGTTPEPPSVNGPEASRPETSQVESTTWSVEGEVINRSQGEVPSGATVTLHGFDGMQETYTETTTVQSDGKYRFEDIQILPGRVFFTTINYDGMVFNSEIAHSASDTGEIALPIMIYDSTSDTSALHIERMHVFFDFSQPGSVQVAELFIISNPGDKVVTASQPGQPVIHFALPEGATGLQFQEGNPGERYIQTSNGFGDTLSVYPGSGEHQILFAFQLPYERRLDVELPMPLPVSAAVVMMPEAGIKIQSDQLQDSGERSIQGMNFRLYAANNLNAGETLNVRLSGRPNTNQAAGLISGSSTSDLLFGMGAFGIALILAGVWFYRMRLKQNDTDDENPEVEINPALNDKESLIDAIIALDDLYRSGQLPEAPYRQRRDELKALLKEKMG
jgi:mono/diheme cytochrome c family protein